MSGLNCSPEVLCQYNLLRFQIRDKVEEKKIFCESEKEECILHLLHDSNNFNLVV